MRCATAGRRSPSGSTRSSRAGCERILIAPLYPQYCAATTATALDEAFRHLRRLRCAAGGADAAALLPRPDLHRRVEEEPRGRARSARFRAAGAGRQLPRHAGAHPRPRRSLSRALPADGRLALGSDGARADHRLPVALRPRQMARTAIPTRCSPRCRPKGSPASRSSPRASPPIAWRRSRSWRSAAATTFLAAGGTRLRLSALPQRRRDRHADAPRPHRPRA